MNIKNIKPIVSALLVFPVGLFCGWIGGVELFTPEAGSLAITTFFVSAGVYIITKIKDLEL